MDKMELGLWASGEEHTRYIFVHFYIIYWIMSAVSFCSSRYLRRYSSAAFAWNRLKKLWRSYKIAGRYGDMRSSTAYEINRLQSALDIPRSDLPELEGI